MESLLRARVILNEPVALLDYGIPPSLRENLKVGHAVKVPLGKRRTSAYVAEIVDNVPPAHLQIKDLLDVDAEREALPISIIELIVFGAGYYGVTPGDILSAALPSFSRPATLRYRLTKVGLELLCSGDGDAATLAILHVAQSMKNGFTVAALEKKLRLSRRAATERVKKLCQNNWLTLIRRREKKAKAEEEPLKGAESFAHEIRLPEPEQSSGRIATAEQQNAIEKICLAVDGGDYTAFLLRGVTGSGKTEVYLAAIERALGLGRSALVLVPEIALTPQLSAIFKQRFGEHVATFHSGLKPSQRREEWERVASGRARIGLGARSALFLPLKNLGIIIVDEEHENTFKQEETPRYNARDLAVVRARKEGAVIVLGSATPSLESHANAQNKRYAALYMHERVQAREMPVVACLNLSREKFCGDGLLTEKLYNELEHNLNRGEQSILFLNRRGFSPHVFCRDCAHVYRCAQCAVSLTLHQRRQILLCHYCGHEENAPDTCSSCQGHRVESFGPGIERLEKELHTLFAGVALSRLDRDAIKKRGDLERELNRFGSGESKILIGTQMVTKGHDFHNVTLVGVVAADSSLNFPDFRAAERTFQQLSQVAGRAGRGARQGRVFIQSYEPDHYAIVAAKAHNYESFAEQELRIRKELFYPPYAHLALFRFEGPDEQKVLAAANLCAEALRSRAEIDAKIMILGPAAAPIARLRGSFRFQILLKSEQRRELRSLLQIQLPKNDKTIRRILDVDPYSML